MFRVLFALLLIPALGVNATAGDIFTSCLSSHAVAYSAVALQPAYASVPVTTVFSAAVPTHAVAPVAVPTVAQTQYAITAFGPVIGVQSAYPTKVVTSTHVNAFGFHFNRNAQVNSAIAAKAAEKAAAQAKAAARAAAKAQNGNRRGVNVNVLGLRISTR